MGALDDLVMGGAGGRTRTRNALADLLSPLAQTWPARFMQGAVDAARLPGDVYNSPVPMTSEEMVPRATDLASLLISIPGGIGGLGSGVRGFSYSRGEPLSFPERMEAAKDAALQRRNRGIEGSGAAYTAKRAPDAPKGSFQRLADETYYGWKGDVQRALDELRRATGKAPEQQFLLAPGETIEDMAF